MEKDVCTEGEWELVWQMKQREECSQTMKRHGPELGPERFEKRPGGLARSGSLGFGTLGFKPWKGTEWGGSMRRFVFSFFHSFISHILIDILL